MPAYAGLRRRNNAHITHSSISAGYGKNIRTHTGPSPVVTPAPVSPDSTLMLAPIVDQFFEQFCTMLWAKPSDDGIC